MLEGELAEASGRLSFTWGHTVVGPAERCEGRLVKGVLAPCTWLGLGLGLGQGLGLVLVLVLGSG